MPFKFDATVIFLKDVTYHCVMWLCKIQEYLEVNLVLLRKHNMKMFVKQAFLLDSLV